MLNSSTNIFERISVYNLPVGEYAVFGSALMDVWGIRPAKDLDIIATPKLFEELKHIKGWELIKANGFEIMRQCEADVTTVQNEPTDGDYCPDRLKLIREAVMVGGIPFVRIEEVVACKTSYGREKDLKDISEIQAYLNSHPDPYTKPLPDYSCRFSFDDLHQARFGRGMSKDERDNLYAMSQEKRNKIVGEWAQKAGWYTEERIGSDGVLYTAFWNGGEKV